MPQLIWEGYEKGKKIIRLMTAEEAEKWVREKPERTVILRTTVGELRKCDKNPCDLKIKGEREELKNPHELPIYKIKGKFYFRDERLGEYRNIKDPQDRRTIDSVDNRDLEKPTAEDTKKVYGD